MPIGVLTNNIMVALGGLIGGWLGPRIPQRVKDCLNQVFGFVALAIAITLIVKVHTLAAAALSVILGALVGSLARLEDRVTGFFAGINERLLKKRRPGEEYMSTFCSVLVLACCSGTGIFGSMNEALTGDNTTILCKAILDFFTVMIFATVLGKFVSIVAIPQMLIFLGVFFSARLISPLLSETMIADFSAVGGIISLTVGMRILRLSKLKPIDLLPALILVLPVSSLWQAVF